MAPSGFPDFSKTQRIVLLLDLNPVLHLPDPNPYLSAILSTSKILLNFPPLSSSLFSFKPFFSSLSPFLSSSKLPPSFTSLSFDYPDSTLKSLTKFLNSHPDLLKKTSISSNRCRASSLAASMRQILHDYVWDPVDLETGSISGTVLNCDGSDSIRSNLVILFSPFCKDLNSLCQFLDVELSDECLRKMDAFRVRFSGFFHSLSNAYVNKDIHCCWIDVRCEIGVRESRELEFIFFESGIKSLDWGVCSTDLIILGSALVPFGLIYPKIGISSSCFSFTGEKMCAPLILEILDVNGKPLECKFSELEFIDVKMSPRNRQNGFLFIPEQRKRSLMEKFSDGITKLYVKEVRRYDELDKFGGKLSDPVIVREFVGESVSNMKEDSDGFFADRVLRMLATELGETEATQKKHIPVWQIFLSFLHREGYVAMVSLSDSKGDSYRGILKPYTVFSAFLSVIHDFPRSEDKDSQSRVSALGKFAVNFGGQGKMMKKNLHDLTWSAFCQAASECLIMELEEAYYTRSSNVSKKLKFLKCWMEQIKKRSIFSSKMTESIEQNQEAVKELNQENEHQVSYAASGEEVCSSKLDKGPNDFCLGSPESFLSSLPDKIQQGIESKELPLKTIAERLVHSSIFWLLQKRKKENMLEPPRDDRPSKVAAELAEILLKEPKDLASLHKRKSLSSKASTSVDIIRAYELQILFRMEILRSEVGTSISELLTQKFIKQICFLLESIQLHMDGGFFGEWKQDDYVERIIKNRYYQTLPDVVDRIYKKMELFWFDDEHGIPSYEHNSEDNNQLQKEKQERNFMGEIYRIRKGRFLQETGNEEYRCKLLEVKKKRERARRFSYFTSSMPDLRRVWVPRQPKTSKPKSDSRENLLKRKGRGEESHETVCETPLTERKQSCPRASNADEEDWQDSGTSSFGSVSKVLFL